MKENILASSIVLIVFLIICIVIYYILNLKNLQKSKKYYEELHKNIKNGKKIEFCGGIQGVIEKVDGDTVKVMVSQGNVMTISRYIITKIID